MSTNSQEHYEELFNTELSKYAIKGKSSLYELLGTLNRIQ